MDEPGGVLRTFAVRDFRSIPLGVGYRARTSDRLHGQRAATSPESAAGEFPLQVAPSAGYHQAIAGPAPRRL